MKTSLYVLIFTEAHRQESSPRARHRSVKYSGLRERKKYKINVKGLHTKHDRDTSIAHTAASSIMTSSLSSGFIAAAAEWFPEKAIRILFIAESVLHSDRHTSSRGARNTTKIAHMPIIADQPIHCPPHPDCLVIRRLPIGRFLIGPFASGLMRMHSPFLHNSSLPAQRPASHTGNHTVGGGQLAAAEAAPGSVHRR